VSNPVVADLKIEAPTREDAVYLLTSWLEEMEYTPGARVVAAGVHEKTDLQEADSEAFLCDWPAVWPV